MSEAARAGERLLIQGAGTARDWGAPVQRVDSVVDTTGMAQVLAYNPADMTVAVGAGIAVRDLNAQLDGQRLALDAARIEAGATVGGLLATGDGGPLRASYGTMRDLVIGVTVILPDATVARSGGHVIKNVAGYDLAKLFTGSLGAFGLIAEVVLRLHPLPHARATVAVPCDLGTGFHLGTQVLASPLEPVRLDWHADQLLIGFEGTTEGVARRTERALALAGADAVVLGEAEETSSWYALARTVRGADGDTVARAGIRSDRLPGIADELHKLAADHGVTVDVAASVGIGVHTVRLHATGSSADLAPAHAGVLVGWRELVEAAGGSVTVHRRAPGLAEHAPCWGRPPGGHGVLRALKNELDPQGRLCPGRFTPWF